MNFAVFSSSAKRVRLVLYEPGSERPLLEVDLDAALHRTGQVWHVTVEGVDLPIEYGWVVDGSQLLIDPYAKAISARRRSLAVSRPFDWQNVGFPRVPAGERVIYEAHVRGFGGSYLGLIDRIPYLKRLEVTTIELLPVFEFDADSINPTLDPALAPKLTNYWGYNPINFFSPHAAFASGADGQQIDEFRTMVRELHRAGIEVFLDVVFNHTAEGGNHVPEVSWSFRGLDNAAYYMLDPATGRYLDFSGCGNTLNCNHPAVRELIRDALVYWVAEMRVDGFRFDLASVLTRGLDGQEMADPTLIDEISRDPTLAGTTMIAEAWDAAGLYQVGRFPGGTRWSEWNGAFRDDVRNFVRGGAGMTGRLATRLAGSSDLYAAASRGPLNSINFVTCHDGFTMRDLVSYNEKHNEMNGEGGRDGAGDNVSWNCGVEGETSDAAVNELRRRQQLNFLTILFASQGTPMLLGGDEAGRTQRGNNNAYCHDNEISWFDWKLAERNAALAAFTRELIAFRRTRRVLRRERFLSEGDVRWHGVRVGQPDFGADSRSLAMQLIGDGDGPDLYLAFNAWMEPLEFALPDGGAWRQVIDTMKPTGEAFVESGGVVHRDRVTVGPYACILLEAEREAHRG